MALEPVNVPYEKRWGQFTTGEAMTRGMVVDILNQTKAVSGDAPGRIGWAYKEIVDENVSDSTADSIANATRFLIYGPGSTVATDQYVESDATGYTPGTLVEISATAGKIQLSGGTAAQVIGIVTHDARPANASATKDMVVVQLLELA